MSKQVKPLTATQIKNAKPKQKLYKLFDGSGLSLWVYPTGNKNWVLRLQENGKSKDYRKPFTSMTLAEARAWREDMRLRIVRDGAIRDYNTLSFEGNFNEWFDKWSKTVTKGTATKMLSPINKHIKPQIGHLNITKLRPFDIVQALKKIEARGTLAVLEKVKSGVRQSLDYAVARGVIDINPASSITAKAFDKRESQHFRALAPDDLPILIGGLERAIKDGKIKPKTYYLSYWQLLTWARPGQAVMAEWSEIDLDNKLWVVSADKMKKRREFVVPLTDLMIDILHRMKGYNHNGKYVFEGETEVGHMSKETVRVAMNRLNINTTAHGFRSLARTTLGEIMSDDSQGLKYDKETLKRCLSHKVDSSTDTAYDRSKHIQERRPILEEWSAIVQDERNKHLGF